jgi:hypothetical protein
MAEGLSATAANALLDSLGSTYSWVQLHTGAPGAAGTANVAAETDRKQVTWGSAAGGAKTNTAELSWPAVAATETYTNCTFWTASTAGTFGFSGDITANQVDAGDEFVIAVGDLDVTFPLAS